MKICTICNKRKRNSSFYVDSKTKTGLRSCCKKCFRARYKYVHSKKKNETWKKYARSRKGQITLLLNNARDRAKRKNLPFDLDIDWLSLKLDIGKCELSGISFEQEIVKQYRSNPFGASIDRIDPNLGYVKTNCRLICFCVNMARSDWGDEILFKMARGIINNNKS